MEEKYADLLMNMLVEQLKAAGIDKNKLKYDLVKTEIREQGAFCEKIPRIEQILQGADTDETHTISVRRILRNSKVAHRPMNFIEDLADFALSAGGWYSSDVLAKKLQQNVHLANLISRSEVNCPYSLLGKVKTEDITDPQKIRVVTMPLLIIPDRDREAVENVVSEWQRANTKEKYEKPLFSGLLG